MPSTEDRLDVIERRADVFIDRFVGYFGILLGLVLTAFAIPETRGYWTAIAALSAFALVWTFVLTTREPVRAKDARVGAVYMVVTLAVTAVLTWLSPFFAFMVLGLYGHAFVYLRGRWRFAAVAAAAAIAAYSQMGGRLAEHEATTWYWGLAALVVANVIVAGGFSWFGALTAQQSERRKKMIAELEESNAALAAALQENAGLHAQLVAHAREAGVQDERQRMAREIHDTIAQGLTGIVTQLEAADAATSEDDVRDRVRIARGLARESLREARRSVDALRPEPLESAQLPDAVADLARRWSQTTGVAVRQESTGVLRPLLPELEVVVFRVAQEALANVGKHAAASNVAITLSYMDDVVVLDVRDDGNGFDPAVRGGGFGLTAMEQRAHRVSGTLTVESAPGEGTALSVCVPAIPAEVSA